MLYRFLIPILIAISSPLSAFASVESDWEAQNITVVALTKTHRAPRKPTTLFLVPGRETQWFYTCTDEDGSVILKHTDHPLNLPEVPDERPFGEKYPNRHAVNEVAKAAIPTLLGVAVGLIGGKH